MEKENSEITLEMLNENQVVSTLEQENTPETIESEEWDNTEVYVDKGNIENGHEKRNKWIFGLALVVLVFVIAKAISGYSPYYNDAVTHFSDVAPRVGNNVYGYIDVPKGFTLVGSFNPADEDYAGGADGIPEGVQLKSEDGKMYIVLSLITPDKKKDDYVGLGDGTYIECDKGKIVTEADRVTDYFLEDLYEKGMLSRNEDGILSQGGWVDVNGLKAMSFNWMGERDGKTYQYQTHIIENPDYEGLFQCVTAVFTKGNEKCVDYVQTFSLTQEEPQSEKFVEVEERAGSKTTGYVNIPKGFREFEGVWYYEVVDDLKTNADFKFFASDECYNTDKPLFEGMVLVGIEKDENYDDNPQEYMQTNLSEMYGYLGLLDYADMSNVKLQDENKEFGAKAFLSVMEQTLGQNGTLTSEPTTLDGHSGYRVTWNGRAVVDRVEMYLSFYILDSAQDENVVYIVGAKERTAEGQFWKYLDTFKSSDNPRPTNETDIRD